MTMKITRSLLLLIALVALGQVAMAQDGVNEDAGNAYRISLYVVVGSGSGGGADVPKAVQDAIGPLAKNLNLRAFKTLATQSQTVGIGGRIESSAIFDSIGAYKMEKRKITAAWNAGQVELLPGDPTGILIARFAFFARVPVPLGDGIDYQDLRYSVTRSRVAVGGASLLGNLPVPETGEVLFFVIETNKAP